MSRAAVMIVPPTMERNDGMLAPSSLFVAISPPVFRAAVEAGKMASGSGLCSTCTSHKTFAITIWKRQEREQQIESLEVSIKQIHEAQASYKGIS